MRITFFFACKTTNGNQSGNKNATKNILYKFHLICAINATWGSNWWRQWYRLESKSERNKENTRSTSGLLYVIVFFSSLQFLRCLVIISKRPSSSCANKKMNAKKPSIRQITAFRFPIREREKKTAISPYRARELHWRLILNFIRRKCVRCVAPTLHHLSSNSKLFYF